jgi:hypothetical protein
MKIAASSSSTLAIALLFSPINGSYAFQSSSGALTSRTAARTTPNTVLYSTPSPDELRRIMEEESTNPDTLAASAAAMKNMTPEDMAKLISEMEKMPDDQKKQLKDMGMDPDTSEFLFNTNTCIVIISFNQYIQYIAIILLFLTPII